MWELDYKESWAPKNWCFWTVVLEKNLESPFNCKEVKPVHPKVSQSLIFIRRTDAEAEAPILWPPDVKNWLEQAISVDDLTETRTVWRGKISKECWPHALRWVVIPKCRKYCDPQVSREVSPGLDMALTLEALAQRQTPVLCNSSLFQQKSDNSSQQVCWAARVLPTHIPEAGPSPLCSFCCWFLLTNLSLIT